MLNTAITASLIVVTIALGVCAAFGLLILSLVTVAAFSPPLPF